MATRTWTLKLKGDHSDAIRSANKVERKFKNMDIDRGFGGKLRRLSGRFESFGTRMAGTGRQIAKTMTFAAVGGVAALGAGLVAAFKGAEEHRKVMAQTEQVIKTMGASSWISAKQIESMSDRLERLTGIDGDIIQEGANLLLTFKNIRNEAGKGNDVYDRTLTVANDMSVALGQDMKSSSIQLGKALNDPIKGVTALQRVGVSFTESQKDQIKSMVESGDLMGAQKKILREVEAQFGGTAKAVASPWSRLRATLLSTADTIGEALFPVVEKITTFLADRLPGAIEKVKQIWGGLIGAFREGDVTSNGAVGMAERLGVALRTAWPHIKNAGEAVGTFAKQVVGFFKENPKVLLAGLAAGLAIAAVALTAFAVSALLAALPVIAVVGGIMLLAGAVVYAYTRWDWFRDAVDAVVSWFTQTALPAIQSFAALVMEKFSQIVAWVKKIWPQVQEAIGHVIAVIRGIIEVFVTVVMALWDRFGSAILTLVQTAWDSLRGIIEGAINIIRGIIQTVLALINGDWGRAWEGMKLIISGVWQSIQAVISLAVGLIRAGISVAWQAILAITRAIWSVFLGFLRVIWNAVVAFVMLHVNVIKAVISVAWQAILAITRAIWNAFLGFLRVVWNALVAFVMIQVNAIKAVISLVWNGIKNTTTTIWNGIKSFVSGVWDRIKETIGNKVRAARDTVLDVIRGLRDKWKSIWGGMRDALSRIWNGIKDKVRTGVNAVIGVINWFIRLINKIPGVNIDEINKVGDGGGGSAGSGFQGSALAQGGITNGPQFLAGEGNPAYPEAVIATDPRYRRRNLALLGWAANKLGADGVPGYQFGGVVDAVKGGVGAVAGRVSGAASAAANFARDITTRALGPVRDAAKSMVGKLPIFRWMKDAGRGIVDKMYNWARGKTDEHQSKQVMSGGGPGKNSGYAGGGVERWRATALRALEMTNSPASWIGSLLRRMNQESGGNPNVINNWDSNAKRGDPSGGLMQNIRSAYTSRVAGFPSLWGTNFLHPLGSIVASIVYTKQRYGSGPAGWDKAGGYRAGLRRVPRDNFPARLHRDEAVLNAREARVYRRGHRGDDKATVHIEHLSVQATTPAEGRAAGKAFLGVLEERKLLHKARTA
jgi:phage-related protein